MRRNDDAVRRGVETQNDTTPDRNSRPKVTKLDHTMDGLAWWGLEKEMKRVVHGIATLLDTWASSYNMPRAARKNMLRQYEARVISPEQDTT